MKFPQFPFTYTHISSLATEKQPNRFNSRLVLGRNFHMLPQTTPLWRLTSPGPGFFRFCCIWELCCVWGGVLFRGHIPTVGSAGVTRERKRAAAESVPAAATRDRRHQRALWRCRTLRVCCQYLTSDRWARKEMGLIYIYYRYEYNKRNEKS